MEPIDDLVLYFKNQNTIEEAFSNVTESQLEEDIYRALQHLFNDQYLWNYDLDTTIPVPPEDDDGDAAAAVVDEYNQGTIIDNTRFYKKIEANSVEFDASQSILNNNVPQDAMDVDHNTNNNNNNNSNNVIVCSKKRILAAEHWIYNRGLASFSVPMLLQQQHKAMEEEVQKLRQSIANGASADQVLLNLNKHLSIVNIGRGPATSCPTVPMAFVIAQACFPTLVHEIEQTGQIRERKAPLLVQQSTEQWERRQAREETSSVNSFDSSSSSSMWCSSRDMKNIHPEQGLLNAMAALLQDMWPEECTQNTKLGDVFQPVPCMRSELCEYLVTKYVRIVKLMEVLEAAPEAWARLFSSIQKYITVTSHTKDFLGGPSTVASAGILAYQIVTSSAEIPNAMVACSFRKAVVSHLLQTRPLACAMIRAESQTQFLPASLFTPMEVKCDEERVRNICAWIGAAYLPALVGNVIIDGSTWFIVSQANVPITCSNPQQREEYFLRLLPDANVNIVCRKHFVVTEGEGMISQAVKRLVQLIKETLPAEFNNQRFVLKVSGDGLANGEGQTVQFVELEDKQHILRFRKLAISLTETTEGVDRFAFSGVVTNEASIILLKPSNMLKSNQWYSTKDQQSFQTQFKQMCLSATSSGSSVDVSSSSSSSSSTKKGERLTHFLQHLRNAASSSSSSSSSNDLPDVLWQAPSPDVSFSVMGETPNRFAQYNNVFVSTEERQRRKKKKEAAQLIDNLDGSVFEELFNASHQNQAAIDAHIQNRMHRGMNGTDDVYKQQMQTNKERLRRIQEQEKQTRIRSMIEAQQYAASHPLCVVFVSDRLQQQVGTKKRELDLTLADALLAARTRSRLNLFRQHWNCKLTIEENRDCRNFVGSTPQRCYPRDLTQINVYTSTKKRTRGSISSSAGGREKQNISNVMIKRELEGLIGRQARTSFKTLAELVGWRMYNPMVCLCDYRPVAKEMEGYLEEERMLAMQRQQQQQQQQQHQQEQQQPTPSSVRQRKKHQKHATQNQEEDLH